MLAKPVPPKPASKSPIAQKVKTTVAPPRLQASRIMEICIASRIGKCKPEEEDKEEQESSLHLDYQLMVQSSALAEIIKETAAQIEENMASAAGR